MNGNEKQVRELRGVEGRCYRIDESCYAQAKDFELTPLDDKGVAFVKISQSSQNNGIEQSLRSALSRMPIRLRGQTTLLVDLAYDRGMLVGIVVSTFHGNATMMHFMSSTHFDKQTRLRVAQNLCIVMRLMVRYGERLNRLDPGSILVEPGSCRVFIRRNVSQLVAEWLRPSSRVNKETSAEVAWDLVFHCYCLLRGIKGAQFECELWASEGISKAPSIARIASFYIEIAKSSLEFKIATRLGLRLRRLSRWKCMPREFSELLNDILQRGSHVNLDYVTLKLCNAFEQIGKGRNAKWALRWGKARQLMFGDDCARRDLQDIECRSWGQRGNGSSSTFWLTTLFCTAAIALCSALNGFAPFDTLLYLLDPSFLSFEKAAAWPYIVSAIVGCGAYNSLIARKHALYGYRRRDYGWSVLCGVAFMTLTKIAFALLLDGRIS